ncbi:MAG TPA: phage/plasmid replication protein [Pyrinomonadaceae bacterium]|nr:phage/plasmid replication protein [Pyrinomonadaceae bacterium]
MYNLTFTAQNSNPAPVFSTDLGVSDSPESNNFCIFDSLVITRVFSPKTYVNIKKFKENDFGDIYYNHENWLNLKWSRDYNRYQHLTFEFQMPRALGFTDNLFCEQTQSDIYEGLGRVNEIASSIVGADCELAEKGKGKSVDANRDFATPNKIEYLELIKRLEIPRMKKTPYKTGVMFANQQTQIKVYDKFEQLSARHPGLPRFKRSFAETYLRIETRLIDDALTRFLDTYLGHTTKTAGLILTPELAEKIVNLSLCKLEMDARLKSFAEWRELVLEKYRPSVAARYIAFVEKINRIGINKVRGKSKATKNRFDHIRRQLRREGLDQLVFATDALPALSDQPHDVWDFCD